MEKGIWTVCLLAGLIFTSCTNNISINQSQELWTEEDRAFLIQEMDRTTREVIAEIDGLSPEQWHFREHPERWTIGEIIEHLEIQNELHFREVHAVSNGPELLEYLPIVEGKDEHFSSYATSPVKSQARWFLQPVGRFCDPETAQEAFVRVRSHFMDFIRETEVDLRKHFTFRNHVDRKDFTELQPGDVRDLHQLILTGIAHTDRHLHQIREIKKHPEYPEGQLTNDQ